MLAVVLVLTASFSAYAVWIEPYWIEVTHHSIPAQLGTPIKIAHLTDIMDVRFLSRPEIAIIMVGGERAPTSPESRT